MQFNFGPGVNMGQYYSQNGEDFVLREFFREREKGFYVDVGAFDGVHLSNSYLFETLGWDGVCVEAHPRYFGTCRENRPGSICIHAACVGDESVTEVTFQSEELGLLSGLQKKDEADIKKRYAGRGLAFKGFEEITVPATTLNRILHSHGAPEKVDFITIDVEGAELQVLRGFDLERYRPDVILVEANTTADEEALDAYLVKEKGYHKARRLVENIFYCRESSAVPVIGTVSLKSFTARTDHPLGRGFNPPRTVLHGLFSLAKVKFLESVRKLWRSLVKPRGR